MHLLLITVIALLSQTSPVSSIEGVVSSRSGEPLPRAVVELRTEEGSTGTTVNTSSEGAFAFPRLRPGRYELSVTRAGYVPMEYKSVITVNPGERIQDIRFALTQTGTIYGRVVDGAGQPLANATVRALKASYAGGQRSLRSEQTAITNDLGEYRLFWLPPGTYFVSALPYGAGEHLGLLTSGADPKGESTGVGIGSRSIPGLEGIQIARMTLRSIVNQPAGSLEPNLSYVTTYFPGTTDPDQASAIEVRPDEATGNVNLTVVPVETHHIRGIIMNGVTGQPAPQAQLRRARASALDVCASRGMDAENCSFAYVDYDKGTFDIGHVTPGTYVLYAMDNDLVAQTVVEVGDSDADNIVLTLRPGITVTGSVVPPIAGVEVRFDPGPPVPGRGPLAGSSMLDGAFYVPGLTPGEYTVSVSGLKGTYVRSITLAGVDILSRGVRITGQSDPPIQIDLGTDVGAIEGQILNAQGAPAIGVTVALVPDMSRRNRPDLYRTAQTNTAGHYQLNDIAPGEYKVFAREDVEPGAWQHSDFIRFYEERGLPVRINEASVYRLDATVIPHVF